MNITDDEIEKLKNSKTESEWNAACDDIKRARKGMYPPDWWPKVQQSGLLREVAARFGKPDRPQITAI